MQTTMRLLEKALDKEPAPYWTKRLKLARTTLNTSKVRGHLSPAIAGAIAEELGEDVEQWIVIAALESERDSACKNRMLTRYGNPRTYDGGPSRYLPRRGGSRLGSGLMRRFCRLAFKVVRGIPHMSDRTGQVYQPLSYMA